MKTLMSDIAFVACVLVSIAGMFIGCGIVWCVIANLFEYGLMNWYAGVAGSVIFGLFNAMYNKLMGDE